jgi:hypothetical protein
LDLDAPEKGALLMFRRVLATAGVATGVLLATAAVAAANDAAFRFTDSWGGSGHIPTRHRNDFCVHHQIRPGHSHAVWVDNGHGDTLHGTVYCSHRYEIPAGWTGPHDGGWSLSIPCPAHERPMNGGSGFDSTPEDALTFIDGSFGHSKDGWWHYRFHNWGLRTATLEFWAVCVNRS